MWIHRQYALQSNNKVCCHHHQRLYNIHILSRCRKLMKTNHSMKSSNEFCMCTLAANAAGHALVQFNQTYHSYICYICHAHSTSTENPIVHLWNTERERGRKKNDFIQVIVIINSFILLQWQWPYEISIVRGHKNKKINKMYTYSHLFFLNAGAMDQPKWSAYSLQ